MKALVLGLGVSGQSASKFLQKKGYTVIGFDDNTHPIEVENIASFDLFVPSPGIPRTHPIYQKAKEAQIRIAGEAQIALEDVFQPCIGVTGTNGKTTVVKMIEHCLNLCGKKAKAVGNVGEPLTNYVSKNSDILVVELSSFQLETLSAKVFEIGLLLNIAEDHLNRYDHFTEYAKTKAKLEHCISEHGKFFVHEEIDPTLFEKSPLYFSGENEEAAFIACQHFGISYNEFAETLSSFKMPPHRLEFVAKINGVSYYNDSKATNLAAVIRALKLMDGPVHLLAGGKDKGLDFSLLCRFADRILNVIVFGEAREKIANAVQHLLKVHKVETVKQAVEYAKSIAQENEIVLFAPGCASFDAYENFAQRGEAFKSFLKE